MRNDEIHAALRILRREVKQWQEPVVGVVAKESRDPFRILIACVLSLRTKDRTTAEASQRLFALASTPSAMRDVPVATIEKVIFPVGFYRVKAKQIHAICEQLLNAFGGRVPDSIDELLTLPGVGRKTANLVVTVGYQKPGICVDIHVHRISN
ncbi:MAG TPA: endonuclease III, partial [Sphingomicrobium sp.]|nr:endonuclease III [Sphingomicrobium sp.]